MSQRKISTVTKSDLIELLEGLDEDTLIAFAYNYGDHWNTTVVSPIEGGELTPVEYSDYHRMFKVSSTTNDQDDDDQENGNDDLQKVFVLGL